MCSDTLRVGAKEGKVRSVTSAGGKHFYFSADVHKLMHGGEPAVVPEKEKIIYARVSSAAQRGDLQRQSDDLRAKYPTHILITDIASGINFQRRGLKTILGRAHSGTLGELVVAHKDRLCRFAFDLVRDVLERSGCTLVVLGAENDPGGEAELADDMLAIANVFVAKRNGQRAATNRKRRREADEEEAENPKQQQRGRSGTTNTAEAN
jgi:predicted site-specific integrase-resolvase